VVLAPLAGASACGRLGFESFTRDSGADAATGPVDASARDSSLADATSNPDAPAGTCSTEPVGDWSAPRRLELNFAGATDDDPTIAADALELYFTSTRPGGMGSADVWFCLRTRPDELWSTPSHVPELSSPAYDNTPGISADGLTIWLASNRQGGAVGVDEDIYVSTRPSRAARWSTPEPVAALNTSGLERAPESFDSDLRIVFHSDRMGSLGRTDFYESARPTRDGAWSTPVPILSLNTTFEDIQLWLNECGTRAYFQSNRDGNTDLYEASRPSSSGDFSGIARITALDTMSQDMDIALSGDERYLVFSSDREGETHIYETSR